MKLIQPEQDESFERFAIRAHRALLPAIRNPQTRNEVVKHSWRKFRGPTDAETVAAEEFRPDKYVRHGDVCIFAEHETVDDKGRRRKYGLPELCKIVRNCNHRIADTSAFAAIADGHTSNPDDPNPREPDVLGYAGPYRLGMIGRKKPRWAIFADEYHLKESAGTLQKKPRRSVELWTFKSGKMHFDPIAALGAEAPRLPLPTKFATVEVQGATVERYSATAPAMTFPGGSNTHTKKFSQGEGGFRLQNEKPKPAAPPKPQFSNTTGQQKKLISGLHLLPGQKDLFDVDGPDKLKPKQPKLFSQQGAKGMAISDDDLRQITAAIAETPHFKWIEKKMQEDQASSEDDDDLIDDGTEGDDEQPKKFGDDPPPEPEADDLSDLSDVLNDDASGDDDDASDDATDEDDQPDKKACGDGMPKAAKPRFDLEDKRNKMSARNDNGVTVEKYAALRSSHEKLIRSHGRLHSRVQTMERETADAKRAARLAELENEYPGIVDGEEERKSCLYSLGSAMSDKDFTKHVATIEKYAARSAPVSTMIPRGELPERAEVGESRRRDAYEQRLADEAVKICTAAMDRGEHMDFDTGMAEAKKRLAKN